MWSDTFIGMQARAELDQLLDLALLGTAQLAAIQRETLAESL